MGNPKRKKLRRNLVWIGLFLLAAGIGTFIVLRKREPIILVQTEKVTRRNLTELVVANGRIQPVLQVKISPEVSGEIIELPVKEGQMVRKGDLLLRIKPDYYAASRRSAQAGYESAISGKDLAEANLRKADAEFKRIAQLFDSKLVSESAFLDAKTTMEVSKASFESARHDIDVAKAALDRAQEDLSKTTIYSPLNGTISKLNSELGERVVGTAMMTGTEIMTIADLNQMEARVDIGEVDVVLIAPGQVSRLEVDAFRDRKFHGVVTEIANSSKTQAAAGGTSQEATKFEVRIRIYEKEAFRPGMSVTSEIETRYRTNVLCVPIQSVTTRIPKVADSKTQGSTNSVCTNSDSANPAPVSSSSHSKNKAENLDKPTAAKPKPIEVLFVVRGDRATMVPVKRGISDDSYTEILQGVEEGQEVISGGYKAISRELEDGKRIKIGPPPKSDSDTDKKAS